KNVHQCRLIQIVQRRHDGHASDELRNHAESDQVFRFHLLEQCRAAILGLHFDVALEPHRAANRKSTLDHLVESDEWAYAYKEDVRGIDLRKLLMGMLSAALRGDISHGAFQHL